MRRTSIGNTQADLFIHVPSSIAFQQDTVSKSIDLQKAGAIRCIFPHLLRIVMVIGSVPITMIIQLLINFTK